MVALTRFVLYVTGRPESSFINYRVGEGMPELAKLRKEYESGERNSPANGSGPTVEILICAELATTTNRQVQLNVFSLKACKNLSF